MSLGEKAVNQAEMSGLSILNDIVGTKGYNILRMLAYAGAPFLYYIFLQLSLFFHF